MCIAPITVYIGLKGDKFPVETSCHECWQCRERAINDWVGRNIAENKTSIGCHAVTLTYGRGKTGDVDHERSALLTYSDVQAYLKRLHNSRQGYSLRYFVTGEYGSTKGRAHWHLMLYWQKNIPPHELDVNFMEPHWPHGWSFWTKPTHKAIRYNCKYIQKDMGEAERQGHLAMSKKPPLGAAYFANLAERYVSQGISPQTLTYRFPEVTRRKPNGTHEIIDFMLMGRSAELFLEHFITTWRATYGATEWPASELVSNFDVYGRVVADANRLERMQSREGDFRRYVEAEKAAKAKARKAPPRLAWRWDPGAFERIENGKQQQKQQQQKGTGFKRSYPE